MLRLSDLAGLVAYHDQLGEVFYALDPEWRIAVANDAALRFARLSRKEAIGRSYWEVVPGARGTLLERALRSAATTKVVVEVEVEATLERERHVRVIATPLSDGLAVALRDITEQRASELASSRRLLNAEEHLRAAAEAASIGTSELDLQSGVGYWSPQLRAILGVAHEVEPSESLLESLVDARDRERVRVVHRRAREGENGGSFSAEFRIRRADDGVRRWVSTRGRVFFGADGAPQRRVAALYDITGRKHAEEGLRESEARFRHLADSAPALIWLTDEHGSLTFANMHFDHVFGRPAASFVPLGWRDLIHPDDLKPFVADFRGAFRAREAFAREVRVLDHAGEIRWLRADAVPRLSDAGIFLGYTGCAVDITESKVAQQRQQESEAKFEAIANSIDQLIWSTQPDGYHDYYNERWYEYTGVPLGSTDGDGWSGLFHPDDQERAWAAWRHSLATGEPYFIEYRLRHRSGHYRWVLGRARPVLDEQGRITRWFGTCTDIHDLKIAEEERARAVAELRQSEARLRELNDELERRVEERTEQLRASEETALRLYNRSPVPQHSIDAQGRYLAVSDGWLELMGYTREEILGRPFFDLVAPFEMERLKPAFERLRREGEIRDFEYNLVGKDGELRPVLVTTRVEYDAKGEFVRSYGVTLDLRARKAAEAALAREAEERRKAEEQLRQAQKMEAVGQLTGGVAHDFNNLLTIIRSSSDLLRRPDLPEERRRRYVQAIADTVERASKVTGQLLAFARRQALKPEVINVPERVQAISDMLRTIVGPRVAVVTDLACEECFVEADLGQFETALVNMAANARDAMEGEGTLTIAVETVAAKGASDLVAVMLTDTGSGIPAEQLPHIFEPFFTTKEVGRGTGLGLSQVYGFAKQSGGDIAVDSEPGRGTRFTLYLPRVADGQTQAPSAPPRHASAAAVGTGRRVLIVEDDPAVGRSSADVLQDLGYRTVWVPSAAEALAILSESPDAFDIVFSDVVMPGMGGVALAEEIRRRHAGLPVVLTSGYSHVLAEEGTHGFELVHKPYAAEEISRVLLRLTGAAEPAAAAVGE